MKKGTTVEKGGPLIHPLHLTDHHRTPVHLGNQLQA
jgi:hypothetical protein